eukprot:TRINITY_DN59_c0_g1_i1.p1 TRINITY_DN59_c0_g1~~TRINITY_DN59_c0_g1_i1.p1  ORF type:complete len:165 (-),score=5.72 TRINITY_DN59_c0_g1_i1:56-550(-)
MSYYVGLAYDIRHKGFFDRFYCSRSKDKQLGIFILKETQTGSEVALSFTLSNKCHLRTDELKLAQLDKVIGACIKDEKEISQFMKKYRSSTEASEILVQNAETYAIELIQYLTGITLAKQDLEEPVIPTFGCFSSLVAAFSRFSNARHQYSRGELVAFDDSLPL